ncbi:MAG: UDP-N-acetylmuramoylalanyl-D-glutamyl-2,6-diaminopimelate--D-alanyl-D-alanine ligase [Dongiaceae bacterium]
MALPETARHGRPLWTAAEAAAATGGRATAVWAAEGVSIDSRSLVPGDLFVALAGPNFDGHDFIGAALAAGAAAALASRTPAGLPAGAPLLLVEDTLAALVALGAAARRRATARFIAVTGSVGKTGTKEALRLALESQGPTFASAGNLNNHWGVPLSLARLPRDAAYGVFELGMNHAGEIRPLARQVRPEVAIITAVGPVHLEFFASVEAIADAKAEIFEGVTPGGAAILNRDSPLYERLAGKARDCGIGRVIGFGRHAAAEARLIDCAIDATGSEVDGIVLDQRVRYRIGMPGLHWAINSLAVLAAVQAIGGAVAPAAAALARLTPLKGRGQRLRIAGPAGAFEVIDESYNASPPAMRAAIAVLGRATPGRGGRRLAVLGDMLELGGAAPRLHAELADELRAAEVAQVFTAGPLMAALHDALPAARRGAHAADAARLVPAVVDAVRGGDVVLVKGSLGSRMAQIVEALRALDGRRAANGN